MFRTSIIQKNKNQRKYIVAQFELINKKVSGNTISFQLQNLFHAYANIFIKNLNNSRDFTYKKL